jgi:hypothetical protein
MTYSKYAIQGSRPMLSMILFVMVIVAIVVGATAAAHHVSPWRLFLGACVSAAPILAIAQIEMGRSCDAPHDIGRFWIVATCLVVSLTLYGATAVDGFADGFRQAQAGARGSAFARVVVCPLLCVGGVVLVLFAVLVAALHCAS